MSERVCTQCADTGWWEPNGRGKQAEICTACDAAKGTGIKCDHPEWLNVGANRGAWASNTHLYRCRRCGLIIYTSKRWNKRKRKPAALRALRPREITKLITEVLQEEDARRPPPTSVPSAGRKMSR